MRISIKLGKIKKDGSETFRFRYWSTEAGQPRYLSVRDYPELTRIKSRRDAEDFMHRWNQRHADEKKRMASKKNAALMIRQFNFHDAKQSFLMAQQNVNKSYQTCGIYVERVLGRLVHHCGKSHPAQFSLEDYREVFKRVMGEFSLNIETLKKHRASFNKFLKYCVETGKIGYDQYRPVPENVIADIKSLEANAHDQRRVRLGQSLAMVPTTPAKATTFVEKWTWAELCQLVDFAERPGSGLDPMIAKMFFGMAMSALRKGAFLGLRRSNLKRDDLGRLFIVPDKTIQRFQTENGISLEVCDPDPLKNTPAVIPVWESRFERYLLEWVDKSAKDTVAGANDWLFPTPEGWKPSKTEPKCAPGELPFQPDRLTEIFREYQKAAGLPKIQLKNLRKTGASLVDELSRRFMISPPESTEKSLAQGLCGHSSRKTTERYYIRRDYVAIEGRVYHGDVERMFELGRLLQSSFAA